MESDIDNHKLMYHPERVSQWCMEGDCPPIYVEIGVTNRCNHRCQFCALDWLKRGGIDMDSSVLIYKLENMASFGVKSIMYAGEGEPLCHEDISRIIRRTKESGIDVSMTTNGVAFTENKAALLLPYLSWMRFSVDAGTPQTYAELHGTIERDFEKVITNIKDAVRIKKKNNYPVTIGVQALLTNKSIGELKSLAIMMKDYGVDNLQIKPYSHHPASRNDLRFNYEEAEKIRTDIESLSDDNFKVVYRAKTIQRLFHERDYKECHGLPFFTLIDASGNVLPCNLFYNNPEFFYGNLYDSSFSEIWKSEKRKDVLEKISKKGIMSCRAGCRLDVINRYLDRLKNPSPHDNFI